MPTYEYLCKTCKNRFEKWQRMADDPLTICPECGGPIRRVFYPAGIVFKGSGFYKTDHPGSTAVDPSSPTTKNENGAAAANDTKSATESKPAPAESTSSSTSTTTSDKVAASTK